MDDKISIILPIFNVGDHLKRGIDSLINQTIGSENLEIIMVDDCSTDGSDKIIDEYAEKYDCCIAIHHEKNSGAAYTPRNTGIKACTGDYIMFLDPDDKYTPDACEVLYKTITENNAQIAFGRFRRIFDYSGKVQKSYSPYIDDIEKYYPNETLESENFVNVPDFIWDNFISRLLYGKNLEVTYPRDKAVTSIKIDSIEQEPDLLKMHPSIWCKIYRRDLIMDNNICFQPYISGDDMVFNLETLLYSKGIVFLNNFICYDYFIRDSSSDKSITNNVNVRLLDEFMESYIYCRKCTDSFSTDIQNVSIDPHLWYWFYTWMNASFTKEENKLLLGKVKELKKIHCSNYKNKLLFSCIIRAFEMKIRFAKK